MPVNFNDVSQKIEANARSASKPLVMDHLPGDLGKNEILSIINLFQLKQGSNQITGVFINQDSFVCKPWRDMAKKTNKVDIKYGLLDKNEPHPEIRVPDFQIDEINETEEYRLPNYLSPGTITLRKTDKHAYEAGVVFDDLNIPPIKIVDTRTYDFRRSDDQPNLILIESLIAATVSPEMLVQVQNGKTICIISNIGGLGNYEYIEPHLELKLIDGEITATVKHIYKGSNSSSMTDIDKTLRDSADFIWFVFAQVLFTDKDQYGFLKKSVNDSANPRPFDDSFLAVEPLIESPFN